ncbi:MAG: hypothetical protein Q8N05_04315 [Bacteroidota bacterium]|nr:hypothetical protein [Bacteroidota bacterium]
MKKIEFTKQNFVELDSTDLHETNGGWVLPLLSVVGFYLAIEIAGDPVAHYNAFMKGWNEG